MPRAEGKRRNIIPEEAALKEERGAGGYQLGLPFLPPAAILTLTLSPLLPVGQSFCNSDYWESKRFLEVNLRQEVH